MIVGPTGWEVEVEGIGRESSDDGGGDDGLGNSNTAPPGDISSDEVVGPPIAEGSRAAATAALIRLLCSLAQSAACSRSSINAAFALNSVFPSIIDDVDARDFSGIRPPPG